MTAQKQANQLVEERWRMRVDKVCFEGALARFYDKVIDIDLFNRWEQERAGRLREAFVKTRYFLHSLHDLLDGAPALPAYAREICNELLSESFQPSTCSLYRLQELILQVNDSRLSADYLEVLKLADLIWARGRLVCTALEEMAAAGETSGER